MMVWVELVVLGLQVVAGGLVVVGLVQNSRQHRGLDELRAAIEVQSTLLEKELVRAGRLAGELAGEEGHVEN